MTAPVVEFFGRNFILMKQVVMDDYKNGLYYIEQTYRIEGTLYDVVFTEDYQHGFSLNVYTVLPGGVHRASECLAVEETTREEVMSALERFVNTYNEKG